jgi:hypothetical protein
MIEEPQRSNEELVAAWIELAKTPEDTPRHEELFWSFSKLDELVHDCPELAWSLILEILRADQSTDIMEQLSAGPLEDLLSQHGPEFIDRIEAEARSRPKFAKLLGGVWKLSMTDEIWKRIQAIWDRRGWDGIPE